MTPVRWKVQLAVLLVSMMAILTNSAKIESISMADNGWKPIIGTRRDGPYDEITHYRNPASKKSDPVKAEKQPTASKIGTPSPSPVNVKTTQGNLQNIPSNLNPVTVSKMPPHSKPVFLLPAIGMHTPQLAGISPIHLHRPHKYGHLMKVHHHVKPPRVKPLRHQVSLSAHSTRDEVFVPAPSSNINVGPYTFYSAGQPQLKPRPTHIEFTNHFPIPNTDEELYQIVRAPVHQYVIPKIPIANDVHYTFQNPDDYTRNNPQAPYKFESTKEKLKKVKDATRQEALIQKHPFHLTTPQPHVNNQVEVQVTKEKLKVFHNSIPSNYSPLDDYEYRSMKPTVSHKRPATYEVTEGKWNQEMPIFQYHYAAPMKIHVPTRVITEESKPFLPTPIKPEFVAPTLPTESEIPTIYTQVKQNRQKNSEFISSPSSHNFFDVKEVSTHFPILGPPEFQTISYPTRLLVSNEKENEITTTQISQRPYEQEPETTTQYIPTIRPQIRNRRPNRRRRPTSSTTTEVEEVAEIVSATDGYESQKMETSAEVTTQPPSRNRRPISRYRLTSVSTTVAQPDIETTTIRIRQKRPRPTTTTEEPPVDIPENHKIEYESLEEKFARLTTTTEQDFPANFESHFTAPYKSEPPTEIFEKSTEDVFRPNKFYTNPPNREEKLQQEDEEESSASVEETSESDEKNDKILEDYRVQYHESQKEPQVIHPEITINTPENELDFTTRHSYYPTEETTLEPEPVTVTTTTTTAAPTTTTSTTTETLKRVRGRPVKYDNSNRPRFSVKEYRQRLSTSTTSTEAPKTQNEVMRIRFPNRSRRPITPTPTTHAPVNDEDDDAPKSKFQPKDPRHPNLDSTTTEKLKFNTVNTRIRPFGRFKSTTEATSTTVRVSIKPNIFGNLRRPTPISLKTRILNRQRGAATGTNTTTKPEVTTLDNNTEDNNETDQTEIVETTIPYSVEESDVSDAFDAKKVDAETTARTITTIGEEYERETKQDDFMQSQIVSDLTSSAKNEYNKPGLFKNVQPNSRKVPSYFTLATDDPILPIEAFFPNLKDKQ